MNSDASEKKMMLLLKTKTDGQGISDPIHSRRRCQEENQISLELSELTSGLVDDIDLRARAHSLPGQLLE